jgi:hypothetical protein
MDLVKINKWKIRLFLMNQTRTTKDTEELKMEIIYQRIVMLNNYKNLSKIGIQIRK